MTAWLAWSTPVSTPSSCFARRGMRQPYPHDQGPGLVPPRRGPSARAFDALWMNDIAGEVPQQSRSELND